MLKDYSRQFEQLHAFAQRELGDALLLLRAAQEECAHLVEERDLLLERLSASQESRAPRRAERGRKVVRRIRKAFRFR